MRALGQLDGFYGDNVFGLECELLSEITRHVARSFGRSELEHAAHRFETVCLDEKRLLL